ncbi:MarR family winged helix-turn-helix transcriptional regulator [Streptomyces longispororuber]|uniref:MarR family winged helix-turn-helix transcriptional regulator n=1 Tax=Streptomyces longispororuber TaxID=68230 RepID=UPI00210EE6F6|nr:helix-turn-helix domain-containing protein [Streptomyces longispororuber]MCQ4207412.1 MarR family transcriptional regulator [Streptomyces longispororuber]
MDAKSTEMGLVHLLRAVTVEFDLLGAEFAVRHGLHPTDVRALIHLLDAARSGTRATPGWLGGQLRLNSAGTTALVDRLERLGLVRRSKDVADRRRVLLEVEEKATVLGETFFGPVIGEVVRAAEGFEEAELATVRRFLTAVLESTARAR